MTPVFGPSLARIATGAREYPGRMRFSSSTSDQGKPMRQKKTLLVREKELRALLVTREGKAELETMAARYAEANGKVRPVKTSLVTYIIVHERERGLIEG